MAQIEQAGAQGRPSPHRLKEGLVERVCRLACIAALIVMLVVIAVDILTRSLLNFSFEISDELGGYLLVVITFVSLPVCQISDSFHRVQLVQARLSRFGRAVSQVVFGMLDQGLTDKRICAELGLEADELLRLKHITGFARLFADAEYGKAWQTRRMIQLKQAYDSEHESSGSA